MEIRLKEKKKKAIAIGVLKTGKNA